ncbi:MAG: hypothetical protein WDN08_11350 [Rhizomicrobium sp.]
MRVRAFGALAEQDLQKFIEAKFRGLPTPRLDKPCGRDKLGNVVCQMHLDLNLGHYRLTDHADPLLMYQQFPELLYVFGVTFHEDIFHGNELRWCHAWQHALIWEGCEHHLDNLNRAFGDLQD